MSGIKNCCPSDLPLVVPTGYTFKGTYSTISGLKTYVTGSLDANVGILTVYDAFGFDALQTFQGADLLAASLNAIVFIPDFFEGQCFKEAWLTSESPENKAAIMNFSEVHSIEKNQPKVMSFAKGLKKDFPAVEAWAGFGLCWGGKMTALTSGIDTPFKVSGQAHPWQLAREDAEALTIPHIILCAPSDNEDGGVDAYIDVFKNGKEGYAETYESMHHGWMAGRANLENEANKKEYERGYKAIADYFAKHL